MCKQSQRAFMEVNEVGQKEIIAFITSDGVSELQHAY